MEKKLKKEYDSRQRVLALRLSHQEWCVLEKMKAKDEWKNTCGFVKNELFGEKVEKAYKKMKRSGKEEDVELVMKSLFQELLKQFGYLYYRFNYELDMIHSENNTIDTETAKKISAKLSLWRKDLMDRTRALGEDCSEILRYLNIRVENIVREDITHAPDSVIEKAAKDWNDVSSPAAQEAARRVIAEFNKKQEEALKKRMEK